MGSLIGIFIIALIGNLIGNLLYHFWSKRKAK